MTKTIRSKNKRSRSTQTLYVKLWGGIRRMVFMSFPYVFSFAAVTLLFGSVVAYALSSPVFQLQEVRILNLGTITPDQAFKFCELKRGANMISLDIVVVQQVIKHKHPEFKEVIVRRVLPNRIEVMLKRRTPVVQVAYGPKFIQVDRDLVILPGSGQTPFRNLTVIDGAALPKPGLFVGAVIVDSSARRAIKLAEIIRQTRVLRDHNLSRVDITDPQNISLIVDNDIEIKMGNNHLIERLKILDQTLKTIDLDPSRIKYIDLRFDDVVIGPR